MCVCVHVCVYAFAGIFSLFDFFGSWPYTYSIIFFYFIYSSRKKNLHVLCSRKYSKMTPKDSLFNIFSLFP